MGVPFKVLFLAGSRTLWGPQKREPNVENYKRLQEGSFQEHFRDVFKVKDGKCILRMGFGVTAALS